MPIPRGMLTGRYRKQNQETVNIVIYIAYIEIVWLFFIILTAGNHAIEIVSHYHASWFLPFFVISVWRMQWTIKPRSKLECLLGEGRVHIHIFILTIFYLNVVKNYHHNSSQANWRRSLPYWRSYCNNLTRPERECTVSLFYVVRYFRLGANGYVSLNFYATARCYPSNI